MLKKQHIMSGGGGERSSRHEVLFGFQRELSSPVREQDEPRSFILLNILAISFSLRVFPAITSHWENRNVMKHTVQMANNEYDKWHNRNLRKKNITAYYGSASGHKVLFGSQQELSPPVGRWV